MSEGARGAILARAHVEVLALGSFEVLAAALRAAAIAVVLLLIAVRPLHVSTLVATSAAALVRASALVRGTSASTTTTLVVVARLVAATAPGGVLVMVVVMSTTSSDISTMVALLLQTLVVLLHDGGLGVGISGDWISYLSQLVLSVSEEAGVSLRAGTLLHEVTAELSLELLGVELGPSAH